MEIYDIVKIGDKYGIVMIPSKEYKKQVVGLNSINVETFKTLNKVILSDGTVVMYQDSDLEVDDARTKKFNKSISKLFDD